MANIEAQGITDIFSLMDKDLIDKIKDIVKAVDVDKVKSILKAVEVSEDGYINVKLNLNLKAEK